jgi:glutaredoxin
MIRVIKEEIEIEESLVSRLNIICDFCNTTPTIINGSIRRIEHTNLTYIEPHRIIINDNLYLAFNYSNEIYIQNLSKKIKLSELENYIKQVYEKMDV